MKVMRAKENQIDGLKDLISFTNLSKAKMLEVGSYLGESSRIFAQSGRFSEINCLDLWVGNYDPSDYASRNMNGVEQHFLKFQLEFPDLIKIHKNDSSEIPMLFDDGYFDLIYIDGNHTKEAVKSDILSCIPKIKKGGYIAGHDYGDNNFSVTEVVDELLSSPDETFSDLSWVKKIN